MDSMYENLALNLVKVTEPAALSSGKFWEKV